MPPDRKRILPGAAFMTTDGSYSPVHVWLADGVAPAPASVADWIAPQLLPPERSVTRVGSIVPTGFAACVRVLHPAHAVTKDGREVPVRWADVAAWAGRVAHPDMQWEAIAAPARRRSVPPPHDSEPHTGRLPEDVAAALVEVLRAHTATPDRCVYAVWEGFAGVGEAFPEVPAFELPFRRYLVLRGALDAVGAGVFRESGGGGMRPSLWWPEDRAWCVATEIDFSWTYVAGSASCVARLLADARLEALATSFDARADFGSDVINRPVYPS